MARPAKKDQEHPAVDLTAPEARDLPILNVSIGVSVSLFPLTSKACLENTFNSLEHGQDTSSLSACSSDLLLIKHHADWYAIIACNDTQSVTHQFPGVGECFGGLDDISFVVAAEGLGLPSHPESDPNVPHDC